MRRWGTFAGVVAAALTLAASAQAAPRDTTVRTIVDRDGDNLLEFGPGEDHCVFTLSLESGDECAEADLRPRDVDSLLYFLQLSDFQIVDEESPVRVEFLDTTQRIPGLQPFSAAHRPQESLTTQATEAMVRQARNTTSPITGETLDLTILTGDNADSQQHNETRWFIDILDGTIGPENPDPEMDDRPGEDRKIVPDSGRHELADSCPGYVDNNSIYDGVRDRGNTGPDTGYYEPDGEGDGDGYTPRREQNFSETGRDVTVRDFPGLFEDAQEPFEAVGLGMPWYSAFGNHDALVQGNSPEAFVGPFGDADSPELLNPTYDQLARGCVKPSNLPAGVTAEEFLENPGAYINDPALSSMIVPPDDRRCFLAKDEPNTAAAPCSTGGWIQQHSRTSGFPVGHGFEPFTVDGQEGEGRPVQARNAHDGYYSFKPRPGLRFVVLDTVTDECGVVICSEGSVDGQQYEWLRSELEAADTAGEYVITFSHHTLRTTRMESTDVTERTPPTALGEMHHGERLDRKNRTQPQPVRPDAPPNSTLEDLFCEQENFLGHVAGHEHENYVLGHFCEDPPTHQPGKNPFVEISTAAHIDWPQQSRTIELLTDEDGDLSLALTILDHDGPPNPGEGNAATQPIRLASIAREIAYNDYQHSRGATGGRSDRNVIVATGKKWPPADSP